MSPANANPWIVSLQIQGAHLCGGSIISSYHILTAAHCTDGAPAYLWTIRAGSRNYTTGGQLIRVESIAQHAKYNGTTFANDIAILKLAAELNLRPRGVRAIRLPEQDESIRNGVCSVVAGWGYTTESGGDVSTVLRRVGVRIVSQNQCNEWYDGAIDDGMLCAGFERGGRDSCTYDSGGPLSIKKRLIGIVSWGAGCARQQKPGVYTRVAYFRDWIDRLIYEF